METIEYRDLDDKSTWPRGPWDREPDKKQWRDETTGLPCLIVRNPGGALCGYVGVPAGHPAYRKDYGSVDVEVHGGLTFGAACQTSAPAEHGICHIPGAGEPDDVWWLGFECAHSGDKMPAYAASGERLESILGRGVYRDLGYVEDQVRRLAAQLAAMTA